MKGGYDWERGEKKTERDWGVECEREKSLGLPTVVALQKGVIGRLVLFSSLSLQGLCSL